MADNPLVSAMNSSLAGKGMSEEDFLDAMMQLAGKPSATPAPGEAPTPDASTAAVDQALKKLAEAGLGDVAKDATEKLGAPPESKPDPLSVLASQPGGAPAPEGPQEDEAVELPPPAAPDPAAVPEAAPPAATVPQAIAGVQSELSPDSLTKLATAQPEAGAPVLSGGLKERSAATEEQINQEARRAEAARITNERLAKRQEPGAGPLIGPLEMEYYKKHGQEYGGNKWLAALTPEGSQLYEQRRAKWEGQRDAARAADTESAKSNRLISNAMVGLILRTNPSLRYEDVVNLREGDPIVKLMGQGGLGQDEKLRMELIRLKGKEIGTDSAEGQTALKLAVQEDIANKDRAAKAAGKGGGGGGGAAAATAIRVELLDFLAQKEGIPISREDLVRVQADPKTARTLKGITPDQARQLENMAGIYNSQAGKTLQAQLNTAGQMDTKGAQGVDDTLQRKLKNPEFRWKFSKYAHEMGGAIGRAKVAWANLSDNAKKIIAQIPPNNDWLVNLRNAEMDPRDQKLAASLESLGNLILKERSGSAVTEPEMARFAKESGFAGASLDLFNSPERLGQWLDNTMAQYRNTMDAWESIYGSFKPGPPPKGP